MIALVRKDDTLYFTISDATRSAFVAEGCKPFSFARAGRLVETSWLAIPDRLYDDPVELAHWARNSRDAALQKAAKKKPAKKKARA